MTPRQEAAMKTHLLLIVVILLAGIAEGGEAPINARALEFTLQDQYEKTVSLRQYEGQVVVLIASDKEGSSQNAVWTKTIREKYADHVVVQGLADVSSVPFFLKGKIRNDFKKDGDSILLDWKGEVFKAYGLKKGVSNVILIDKDGRVRHWSAGKASPEAVQELFKKIDALN
jgi:predicted transcriptional regulator